MTKIVGRAAWMVLTVAYPRAVHATGPRLESGDGLPRTSVTRTPSASASRSSRRGASTSKAFQAPTQAEIPAAWFVLPGSRHGEMGPEAQRVTSDVLRWLEHPEPEVGDVVRTARPRREERAERRMVDRIDAFATQRWR